MFCPLLADCAHGGHTVAFPEDWAVVLPAGHAPPPAPLPPTTRSWEQPYQRQSNNVHAAEEKSGRPAFGRGMEHRRFPYGIKTVIFLLVGAILAAPMNTVLISGFGIATGASAAPCTSGNATSETTSLDGGAQQVIVTNTTNLDLKNIFKCEGGDFDVYWSGEVIMNGTIVIGNGTTVRIFGDINSNAGYSSLSDIDGAAGLTSGLDLPVGLTSAVVGVGPPNARDGADETVSFGSMFYVYGGTLILNDFVVRGGFADNTTGSLDGVDGFYGSGGGIFAVNSSVIVDRCEFNNNFAENKGGGIFAIESTIQVVDAVFTICTAGFMATLDDEEPEGAGGGIYVIPIVVCNVVFAARTRFSSSPHSGYA